MNSLPEQDKPAAQISAVIISYNRAAILGATLQAVQFADEVILIDKSSNDGSIDLAQPLCDRIIQVPWSPTVEETRALAVQKAKHEWILLLDDDEILNLGLVKWLQDEIKDPRAEIYRIPRREHIMGRHDENAYYWPEHQVRFFRKGAVEFTDKVHGGTTLKSDRIFAIDAGLGVAIEHLSHADVSTWISKTNRYTSSENRERVATGPVDLASFAKDAVDRWMARTHSQNPGDYPQAAALLRTTYDIIDRLKIWETDHGIKGDEAFQAQAEQMIAEHKADQAGYSRPRLGQIEDRVPVAGIGESLQREIVKLRNRCAQQEAEMVQQQAHLQKSQVHLIAVLNSTWWRIGEPFRRAGRRMPRLARIIHKAAWTAGKFYHYGSKGVLGERLLDYLKRYRMRRISKGSDLARILGLPIERPQPQAREITLPRSDNPVVSIVIPAFGNVDMTLRCLASIANASPKVAIDVWLAEDASGDPKTAAYADVKGLNFIDRKENLGFLKSSNDAVQQSKGRYVFLLNNDTEIMPGAIEALVDLAEARPDAGIVGARLIFPDGRQQEAGGIVWQDGSAWNYGRDADPRRPEFNYVREVDYISGAAILMPRQLWDRLGGFDEHYSPAYCEDTDLAFRVRREGLKVLYQPRAWVIHHEGASNGTDVTTGIKSYQVTNGHKLYGRWKETFARELYPNGTQIMRARDRAKGKKIVLIIDHYVPEPDRDAGSRTLMGVIEAFVSMGCLVKFFPASKYESPEYAPRLQQLGVEVIYGPWVPSFEAWIQENGAAVDQVFLSRPTVAPMFLPDLRRYSKAKIVFYGHDLHYARMEQEAEVTGDQSRRIAAQEMKDHERRVWLSVDHVLYLSEEEVAVVRQLEPSVSAGTLPIYAFPSQAEARLAAPKNTKIVFVAGFRHKPNVDAAIWLVENVLPHVRAVLPSATLDLVGSNPTPQVQALAGNGIVVTGQVTEEELLGAYQKARVAVVPLRFGAGVKMKVIEALHYGVPLVTTPTGAQGLPGLAGVASIEADPKAFAAQVIRLLTDDVLWLDRSRLQAQYATNRFSVSAMCQALTTAFTSASMPYRAAG